MSQNAAGGEVANCCVHGISADRLLKIELMVAEKQIFNWVSIEVPSTGSDRFVYQHRLQVLCLPLVSLLCISVLA